MSWSQFIKYSHVQMQCKYCVDAMWHDVIKYLKVYSIYYTLYSILLWYSINIYMLHFQLHGLSLELQFVKAQHLNVKWTFKTIEGPLPSSWAILNKLHVTFRHFSPGCFGITKCGYGKHFVQPVVGPTPSIETSPGWCHASCSNERWTWQQVEACRSMRIYYT